MTILAVDEFMRLGAGAQRRPFGDDNRSPRVGSERIMDRLSEFRKTLAATEDDLEPEGRENGP